MARPERNNVDYFPFICEDGNKMFYIEETYGNDGFATFVKLLRELAKTNYHYLDLSKPSTMMFLSAKCKVSKDVLECIIKDLVELGKFDKVLWNENKVIWCQDFIDSIQDAYVKRNNKCITYEGLLLLLISLGIRKPSKLLSKGVNNTQSKVEDSKVEDSINISFDVFWNLYNKKKGDKDKIEKKWNKLTNEDRQKIIDTLPTFLSSISDKKYIPFPETYLNNKRWNDELEPQKEKIFNISCRNAFGIFYPEKVTQSKIEYYKKRGEFIQILKEL